MRQTILIVDTDEGAYRYLTLRLADSGLDIHYISDSLEALDAVKKVAYDMAVVEVEMPEIDGTTLLKRFKEIDPDMRALMMGKARNIEQTLGALKYKVSDFLQKPFGDFGLIRSVIERTLKERSLAKKNRALLKDMEEINLKLSAKVEERTRELEEFNILMLDYTEELSTIIQGVTNLQTTMDLDRLTLGIVEGLKENFHVERALLVILEKEGGAVSLLLKHSMGIDAKGDDLADKDFMGLVDEVARTGRAVEGEECKGRWPAGDSAFGNWTLLPMKAGNEVTGILVANVSNPEKLDVLRIYINMVSLVVSNASLFEKVRIKTIDLRSKTEELESVNERLKELDAMKTSLMNMVAHDIRTPLTSINAYADLLLRYKDKPQETREKFLKIIKSECRRLENLVSNFLNLKKIESGKVEFNPRPENIKELLEHFVSVHKAVTDSKGIGINLDMEGGLPLVDIDKEGIGQVVSNLLSNAVKFTPDGGSITVSARQEGDFVRVGVEDNGHGIPSDDLDAIFDKFTQARGNKTKGGTGLGLAIAKTITEKHGGRIRVESEQGKGSRFYFTVKVSKG